MAGLNDDKNKQYQDIANGAGQKLKNTSNDKKDTDKKSVDDGLKRLGSQLNDNNPKNNKEHDVGGIVKRILVVLLIVILLGGIGVAIYFFTKSPNNITQAGIINLSTKVTENLEDVSPTNPSISTAEIYPGEKYSVHCMVRNSENIDGDDNLNTYSNIYVRFTILLEVDGNTYNNVIVPVIPDLAKESWHIYNPDEEVEEYVWDGYYYYYGSLAKNQSLTLFEEIEFDFHNTMNSFGGKNARITINIEAVHAEPENLGVEAGNSWSTAPRRWINNMQKGINNSGGIISN